MLLTILSVSVGHLLSPELVLADARFSILYYESLAFEHDTPARPMSAADKATELMHFDAFGRRFEVELERRLWLDRDHTSTNYELFTGRLAATPRTWARLMFRGNEISGVIHEFSDTYIIEPRSQVLPYLVNSNPDSDGVNIIYRLADTLVAPGLLSCAIHPDNSPVNGKVAISSLQAELSTARAETAAAHVPTATVGAIADIGLYSRFGADTDSELRSLFNIVDGFFSEQVGVEIKVSETLIISDEMQSPFSTTALGSELLDELGDWRRLNQRDLGLTHLVTERALSGEDPNNSIAGLSFFGVPGRAGVCFARSGAGVSVWFGSLTALIITHEIAHNFGAPHDGEAPEENALPNPCESTPSSGFIMSASLSSTTTDQFSQCSLTEMQKVIDAADCLLPEPTAGSGASSGGGGSMDYLCILILLMTGAIRRFLPDLSATRFITV